MESSGHNLPYDNNSGSSLATRLNVCDQGRVCYQAMSYEKDIAS